MKKIIFLNFPDILYHITKNKHWPITVFVVRQISVAHAHLRNEYECHAHLTILINRVWRMNQPCLCSGSYSVNRFWWCTKNAFWRVENAFLAIRSNSHSMVHSKLAVCLRLVNVFSFEIWSTFVFLLFVSKGISTQYSINLLDCSRLHIDLLSDILIWSLFWGPKEERKAYWKLTRFNLPTDFGGVQKMHFGELKMCFLPTAPIHIVWYIRKGFDCLQVSKCVFIWNMIDIRFPLICFKSYHHPNFDLLTRF
jgi:hypothetical protein